MPPPQSEVVQAGQLVMKDFVGVASSVSRKMFMKMRLRIDPKQPTSKCLVIILAARADIPRSPTKSLFLPPMLDYRKPTIEGINGN